jgi:Na+/proline symporter
LQYAIQLQLLGGVWIIQTMPAVLIGLYTRWFNAWALLIGWAAGTFAGTYMVASVNFASTYSLTIGGWTFPGYIALYALILNLVIAIVVTPLMNTLGAKPQTRPQRRIITPDISSSATDHWEPGLAVISSSLWLTGDSGLDQGGVELM